ncbi:TPA: M4 family metallopeptidase [Morganella morganii]|uniref:M4 family metallopeptidase n=1 Tax=Morganella morganii TaxID=582 RepID=UPI001049BFA2|nr:M4 family metallopeptidase [Morganella morganii]ELA9131681.1 M4 family metallopeptidase [Morganella morganii]
MSAHAPRYSFLPPWILKKRLLHEGDHEETQLCYQHMQRLLGYRRLPETEMMPLSYAALPESGCTSQAHRRVMHLKNLTTVPDLYYREDRKAENPQPHMPVRQDTDTDNMFEYLDIIYGFFDDVFDYKSFNDNNATISAMTHYGRGYCNAFWNGAHLVFGAGDAGMSVTPLFLSFAQLDIATHEFSHAVIDHLSPLTYSHQSGALNESVCDVFTVMLGHYHRRHASHQGDWHIGRTLFNKQSGIKALRSLSSPGNAYNHPVIGKDKQVAHMRDYIELPDDSENDNGGVHCYSGIPNHAFYHFASALGGYSWEVAGQIWFDTLRRGNLPPECNFLTFARETLTIADENYDEEVTAVLMNAWKAVGLEP